MRKEAQVGFQAGAAFGAPLTARGPPRGAVQVLFLPVPSLPLLGARDLCRAELASFGLVLRPGGLPLRQGPRRFGPREGLRRSPGRTPAPRALESGAWVSCGLRRASPGDFTAWPRCVCVCVVGPGGQRTAREGTKVGTQGEDGGLGPPGLQRTGEAKASLVGPARGLWLPSSPGRKRRRRLGLLPAVKGEAAAATTAGAPAASAASGVQGGLGADTGSSWVCLGPLRESPSRKPGASASGSGGVMLGRSAFPWGSSALS